VRLGQCGRIYAALASDSRSLSRRGPVIADANPQVVWVDPHLLPGYDTFIRKNSAEALIVGLKKYVQCSRYRPKTEGSRQQMTWGGLIVASLGPESTEGRGRAVEKPFK
jgi:hypothetical protein